jgi:hypothetical protein
VVLLFLSYSCSNPHFHTFFIQVKDGLLERTNPSIRRGWKATDLLGDGKPRIKNFGVVFCEKRPHFFLPVTLILHFCSTIQQYKWKSSGVSLPNLKPSTVYPCAGGLNGHSLNFEYIHDASRAESSDNLKSPRQILPYYTWRHRSYAVCHSGLDPESSAFLDSRFRGNDVLSCD